MSEGVRSGARWAAARSLQNEARARRKREGEQAVAAWLWQQGMPLSNTTLKQGGELSILWDDPLAGHQMMVQEPGSSQAHAIDMDAQENELVAIPNTQLAYKVKINALYNTLNALCP